MKRNRKIHPAIGRVQAAARGYVAAMEQTQGAIARVNGLSPEQGRALVTTAIDQETMAFRAVLQSAYDQELLDLIAGHGGLGGEGENEKENEKEKEKGKEKGKGAGGREGAVM